jgi:hypothetical protein
VATFLGMPRNLVEQIEVLSLRKLAKIRNLRKSHWDGH